MADCENKPNLKGKLNTVKKQSNFHQSISSLIIFPIILKAKNSNKNIHYYNCDHHSNIIVFLYTNVEREIP